MKLKSTLLAATLALFATSTATASAADIDVHDSVAAEQGEAKKPAKMPPATATSDIHDSVAAGQGEAKKPAKMPPATATPDMHDSVTAEQGEAKKPAKKKVKRHNHMEEKTGLPMSEPVPAEGKEMPKNRHDHTKEKR